MIVARLVGLALVVLMVEHLHSSNAANCRYGVFIHTIYGTTARVYIRLYGSLATCPWRRVPRSSIPPNMSMFFVVTCPCLGQQRGLYFRLDNIGAETVFGMSYIHVQKYPGGFLTEYHGAFVHAKGVGKYVSKWVYRSYCTYQVRTATGFKTRFAGTHANVYIKLYGSEGNTGWNALDHPGRKFYISRIDVFTFGARCVGYIKQIMIRHTDRSPQSKGWYLQYIGVRHVAPKEKPNISYVYYYSFPKRWMPHESSYATDTQYKVVVYTGSQHGAGTDAKVTIRLYRGTEATTYHKPLYHQNADEFERGAIDHFYVNGYAVGPVTRIFVIHDGSGNGPWWYVRKIYVRVLSTFELFKCPCYKWLTTSKPYTYSICYQIQ